MAPTTLVAPSGPGRMSSLEAQQA